MREHVEAPPDTTTTAEQEQRIAWRLFTIGEVALVAPRAVGERLVHDVEALVEPALVVPGRARSVANTQCVRAHAFVALGKLCLENERLAKRCVLRFVRELQRRGTPPVVRNNVLLALCDLCVRYTGLVDSHVPTMALCLVDASALVRRQALFLFTRLLQEGFLKMKGPLFFYLLRLGADPDPALAQDARQCLLSLVRGRESLTFFMHFVEAMFHLNNYTAHPQYNHMHAYYPGVDPAVYAAHAGLLAGDAHAPQRMLLYTAMLRHMTPEHKLELAFKLAQEVLAAVAEGELPLPAAEPLVRDALAVLSSKEIKVGAADALPDDEDADGAAAAADGDAAGAAGGAGGAAAAVAAAAKGMVLATIARKNVVESIVPIAMELKRFFEKQRSPLQRDLTLLFKVLMQDYKKEMSDIFAANKQLASEIEYDLRQLKNPAEVVVVVPSKPSSSSSSQQQQQQQPLQASAASARRPSTRMGAARTPRRVVQMMSPAPSAIKSARASLASNLSVPRLRRTRTVAQHRLRHATDDYSSSSSSSSDSDSDEGEERHQQKR